MSHRLDYINLKEKYVNLKQKGGANDKFLPCEIMYHTKALYLNKEMIEPISPSVDESIMTKISTHTIFNQDPYIFLKNSTTSENSFIKIVHSDMDIGPISVIDLSSSNGNDKGGNFISSPPHTGSNGFIFCFSGASPGLISYLTGNCIQPLIQLECSFRVNGQRHIDECMAIMPYGINKFKVWFYDIGRITYTHELQENLKNLHILSNKCNARNIETMLKNKQTELLEEIKTISSEFILSVKQSTLAGISELLKLLQQIEAVPVLKYDQSIAAANITRVKKLFHIDFNTCLDIFYNEEKKNEISSFINKFNNVVSLQEMLKAEQQRNLNIVSNAVFGKPYTPGMPEFVIIPIDITADDRGNFKLDIPSIFNRLWIETPVGCNLFFSNRTSSFSSTYGPEILDILRRELPLIKSYLTDLQPTVRICDTSRYHYEGYAGGNLHCLVKNLYN
jgi:hypothetical protein